MEYNNDLLIVKYNKKTWFISALLGFFIGLAVIIPGVSGSTIAIIFGLYASLLYAFGNIFKHFKKCVVFLIPILIGAIIGFIIGFFALQYLYKLIPFSIICLFAGLMLGAFPIILDEIKPFEKSAKTILLLILGIILPLIISIISILLTKSTLDTTAFTHFPFWLFLAYLPLGFALGVTQIIPGLSATAILLAVGQFKPLLNSIHLSYILKNPLIIVLLLVLVIGFILGIIIFSKVLNYSMAKNKKTTYSIIVGLSLGSIISMFVNPDIFSVYKLWVTPNSNMAIDLSVGIFLFVIGVITTYSLVLFERKYKNKNNNS